MATTPAAAPSSSCVIPKTATSSGVIQVDAYSSTKALPIGTQIPACSFLVGGSNWSISYLPRGTGLASADFICFFLALDKAPVLPALARLTVRLLDRNGKPVPALGQSLPMTMFTATGISWGIPFIKRERLERSRHLRKDRFSVRCDITVVTDFNTEDGPGWVPSRQFVEVPPSELSQNCRALLESEQGADVWFHVDGVDFAAHRFLVAVRSPVFKAELFKEGSSNVDRVEIENMKAKVFKNMLYFIYSDELPELGVGREEEAQMAKDLILAADRYGMERLKRLCEKKLCGHICVSTLTPFLKLAEEHHCKGLKNACLDFLKAPRALAGVIETEDFDDLSKTYPSLLKDVLANLAER